MITRPTVLVLGAGASKEFFFPLGWELMQKTCSIAINDSSETRHLTDLKFSRDACCEFGQLLRDSRATSVDAFLAHRRDLVDIGKAIMAAALIPSELPQNLYTNRPSWLHWLSDRMQASDAASWRENQLAIITFNYDRVFEQFFHTSLMSRFRLDGATAADLLRRTVKIIHIHGLLGELPDFGSPSRPFSDQLTPDSIRTAAAGIKVLHEGAATDPAVQEARQLLGWAEVIRFLGFGYNADNMERLALQTALARKSVMGSTIGMEDEEVKQAVSRTGKALGHDATCTTLLELLRRYPIT
jgi:hypothetical protein